MEPVMEEEEYKWSDVELPPVKKPPELERETRERRRGRHILITVDHGPSSIHAFDWAIVHFCRLADTIHLVIVVSSLKNEIVYNEMQGLLEKLSVEAMEVAMVETKARIVEGDAGKAVCKEVERLKPAALVVGSKGKSSFQSLLQGRVSHYCIKNCKAAPVIIVPAKGTAEAGEESVI